MDITKKYFEKFLARYQCLKATQNEILEVAAHLLKRIENHPNDLWKSEKIYLDLVLYFASSQPINHSESLKRLQTNLAVKKVLNEKSTDEARMRRALELLGYSIKSIKSEKSKKAASIYRNMINHKGDIGFYHDGQYLFIAEKNQKIRRTKIIELIRKAVYDNSITVASVEQAIRREIKKCTSLLQTPTCK